MKIGPRTRKKAVELVAGLLEAYQKQIDKTYADADGNLDINFKVRLSPAGDRGTEIIAQISFVESKIIDAKSEIIDEKQIPLPKNKNK